MNDNTPAKFITVWLWHHDEPAQYILCKVNLIVINYLRNVNPTVPVSTIDMTMTTFFEIAVYLAAVVQAVPSQLLKVAIKVSVLVGTDRN